MTKEILEKYGFTFVEKDEKYANRHRLVAYYGKLPLIENSDHRGWHTFLSVGYSDVKLKIETESDLHMLIKLYNRCAYE